MTSYSISTDRRTLVPAYMNSLPSSVDETGTELDQHQEDSEKTTHSKGRKYNATRRNSHSNTEMMATVETDSAKVNHNSANPKRKSNPKSRQSASSILSHKDGLPPVHLGRVAVELGTIRDITSGIRDEVNAYSYLERRYVHELEKKLPKCEGMGDIRMNMTVNQLDRIRKYRRNALAELSEMTEKVAVLEARIERIAYEAAEAELNSKLTELEALYCVPDTESEPERVTSFGSFASKVAENTSLSPAPMNPPRINQVAAKAMTTPEDITITADERVASTVQVEKPKKKGWASFFGKKKITTDQLKGQEEEQKRRLEEQRMKEEERRQLEEQKRRLEEQKAKEEEQKRRLEEQKRKLEEERARLEKEQMSELEEQQRKLEEQINKLEIPEYEPVIERDVEEKKEELESEVSEGPVPTPMPTPTIPNKQVQALRQLLQASKKNNDPSSSKIDDNTVNDLAELADAGGESLMQQQVQLEDQNSAETIEDLLQQHYDKKHGHISTNKLKIPNVVGKKNRKQLILAGVGCSLAAGAVVVESRTGIISDALSNIARMLG